MATVDRGLTMRPLVSGSVFLAVLAVGGLAVPAAAQAPQRGPSEAAVAMVGSWEFSNADREKRCTVAFAAGSGPRGMKVEFNKGCTGLFPFVAEVATWSVTDNGFLRLLNAKGQPVLEFTEVESGMYEAPKPGEGILFIQSAKAAGPAPRLPEQMAGDWDVMRGAGRPRCTITLVTKALNEQDLALSVKSGCDEFVTRFAPRAWQMDRAELIIKGARGAIWRFGEDDAETWQRVPEGREPVSLVRRP